MENAFVSEVPAGASQIPPEAQAMQEAAHMRGPAQLPPQMFTTAAQLLDLTDKKLVVVLRDGRKLIGILRSWDQFANLVLQSTTERIFATVANGSESHGVFADISHGVFLVRGENVLLLGEIDLDKDDDAPPGYEAADLRLVMKLAADKKAADKAKDKLRIKKLAKLGFEAESVGDIVF